MLDNNEELKVNQQFNNHKANASDDWQEINDLLKYAEKLKNRCDELSDRIFLLNTVQLFLIFLISFFSATIFGIIPGFYLNASTGNIIIPLTYVAGMLSFLFIEASSRILKIRISTDKRGLDSTIDFLRENSSLLSKDWSSLEKIQLKIKLSLFDISTSISPWTKLKKSFSGNFLFWLAGVDANILTTIELKSEINRYKVIGFNILLNSSLAFMSGYVISSYVLAGNQFVSIFLGMVWSIVFLSAYRFLIVSTSISSLQVSRISLFITNVIRILLTILISLTISVPLELLVFKSEIEDQIIVYNKSVHADFVEKDNRIQRIDDQIKSANVNIFAANQTVIRLKDEYYSEIRGESSKSSKGVNLFALTIKKDLEDQLEFISKSEKSKYILEREREERVLSLENTHLDKIKSSSLVSRINALVQLSQKNSTIGLAGILINVIIGIIEIIPIAARLLMNDTLYEKMLRRKEAEILNRQEKDIAKQESTNEDESSMGIKQDLISNRLLRGIHDE
jgi:Domain of unknown function (DUF4407)